MRTEHLMPCLVEHIPETLTPGVVYVSMSLASAIHLCACGCGEEVVTPLSPTDWRLIYDGENVSLRPSIGNWNFACRSHYWLTEGWVRWSGSMSSEEVRSIRHADEQRKGNYYQTHTTQRRPEVQRGAPVDLDPPSTGSGTRWLAWLRWLLS